jgi:hypothetical protein
MGRDNTIRGFPVHGAGVPFSGNRDTKGIAMTVNNPVVQPDGVVEAVELLPCPFCGAVPEYDERVGMHYVRCARCGSIGDVDVSVLTSSRAKSYELWNTRAPTPDSIAEKARRVVDALSRGNWLLADVTEGEIQQMVAIITTEFGVGGGDN